MLSARLATSNFNLPNLIYLFLIIIDVLTKNFLLIDSEEDRISDQKVGHEIRGAPRHASQLSSSLLGLSQTRRAIPRPSTTWPLRYSRRSRGLPA